jgi:hypothetical protein
MRYFLSILILTPLFFCFFNTTYANTNYNIGTISSRVIFVNIPESDSKLTDSDVTETKRNLGTVGSFIKTSSYAKANFKYTIQGILNLPAGVCEMETYGEQANKLVQLALETADKQKPFTNYQHFTIIHPQPNCTDDYWSAEGYGNFKTYELNGRVVKLRGVRTPSVDVSVLKHEFGHSLGYKRLIGHPDYLLCTVTQGSTKVVRLDIDMCESKFDFYSGILPAHDIMSDLYSQHDFGLLTKRSIGWISDNEIITATTTGTFTISPFGIIKGTKALRIPVAKNTTLFLSLRNGIPRKSVPRGIVTEIYRNNLSSFLVVNPTNYDLPLKVGTIYEIGNKKIRIDSIKSDGAQITVLK